MMPFKAWIPDEVLTSSDVNSYLMRQSVAQFASTAARDAAILSPTVGQLAVTTDTNTVWQYRSGGWTPVSSPVICTSTTRPSGAALFAGLSVFETDTGRLLTYSGSTWVETGSINQSTSFTPVFQQGAVLSAAVTFARYQRRGNQVDVAFRAVITSAGTAGQDIAVYLPPSLPSAVTSVCVGAAAYVRASPTTVYVGSWFISTSNTVTISRDGQTNGLGGTPSFAAANGDSIQGSFSYFTS